MHFFEGETIGHRAGSAASGETAFDESAWRARCQELARARTRSRNCFGAKLDVLGFADDIETAVHALDPDDKVAGLRVAAEFGYIALSVSAPLHEEAWRTVCGSLADLAFAGCGLSHDLYVSRFGSAVDRALTLIRKEDRKLAVTIAREWDYASSDEIALSARLNSEAGYCMHGIERDCCPAGCGDK